MQLAVILTARPSYARVKSILTAIRASADIQLKLIVAGSALLDHYGSLYHILQQDGFVPDRELYSVVEGESAETSTIGTALLLTQLTGVLKELRPDYVLVIADRHEVLAGAVAASYLNIPLIHLQGGEVTGNIDQKVRYAITALADYHGVATALSRRRVFAAGAAPDRVNQIGCPSIDLCRDARPLDHSIEPIIVLQHSVTNESVEAAQQIETTLEALEQMDLQYLVLWPGHDAGTGDTASVIRHHGGGRHLRNVQPEQFYRYLLSTKVLVGNSSVGIRECSYLGVPVVNIGTRQQGRERASNVIDVPHSVAEIKLAVGRQLRHGPYSCSTLYGDGKAAQRFVEWMQRL